MSRLQRQCGFPFSHYLNPIGRSGDLSLWWDDYVHVTLQSLAPHFINCIVQKVDQAITWHVTFVYDFSM